MRGGISGEAGEGEASSLGEEEAEVLSCDTHGCHHLDPQPVPVATFLDQGYLLHPAGECCSAPHYAEYSAGSLEFPTQLLLV